MCRYAISTLVLWPAKGRGVAAQFASLSFGSVAVCRAVGLKSGRKREVTSPRKGPMTISMYKVSVPFFIQFLTAQSAVIDKLAAHVDAKKLDASYYFNLRFFADMYPYARQVQQASTHAARCCSALAGVPMPDLPNTEKTLAASSSLATMSASSPARRCCSTSSCRTSISTAPQPTTFCAMPASISPSATSWARRRRCDGMTQCEREKAGDLPPAFFVVCAPHAV